MAGAHKGAILLDAGNSFAGLYRDPEEAQARARLLMKIYGQLGYRFVAVGLKDLNLPVGFLLSEAKKNHLKLLSANVFKDGKRPFAPYAVTTVQGIKIGIIGLTDYVAYKFAKKKEFTLKEPHEVLGEVLNDLKTKGADLVVLMTDVPEIKLKALLSGYENINLVIMSGRGNATQNPLKIGHAYALSPLPKGKGLGVTKIFISQDGTITKITNAPIALRSDVKPDPNVAQEVKALLAPILKKKAASQDNPFIRALRRAKKKRLSAQQSGGKGPDANASKSNPFFELLKKEAEKNGRSAQTPQ